MDPNLTSQKMFLWWCETHSSLWKEGAPIQMEQKFLNDSRTYQANVELNVSCGGYKASKFYTVVCDLPIGRQKMFWKKLEGVFIQMKNKFLHYSEMVSDRRSLCRWSWCRTNNNPNGHSGQRVIKPNDHHAPFATVIKIGPNEGKFA